ncbi:MAG: phosphoserine phosphatase [Cyanobacteria bacterium RYN_339]|nr:phosphoserine phosphatase [Cyanobacteria bacterium RYN_339]
MFSFCMVATLPAMLVLSLQVHDSEQLLVSTVSSLASHESSAIQDTGAEITRVSLVTLDATNQRLIGASEAEIERLSHSMNGLGQQQLKSTSRRIIELGQTKSKQLTRELVALDRKALTGLADEMKQLSADSNRELVRDTSDRAAVVIQENTHSLIEFNDGLSRGLGTYLDAASRETTARVSQNLKEELRQEPLVNFRLLAQIMAQSFGGAKTTSVQGAHVTLVNRGGEVVASTRYKRGVMIAGLEIVRRALHDEASVAATRPLVTFADGSERFIGVYDRRPTGGAVIVVYSMDLAEADVRKVESLVDGSLMSLAATTSHGAERAIARNVPRIQEQERRLALEARQAIQDGSNRVSKAAAAKMTVSAQKMARAAEARMTQQAAVISQQTTDAMNAEAKAMLAKDVGAISSLAAQSAIRARDAMTQRAHAATGAVSQQVQPRLQQIGQSAADQIPKQVADAIASSRRRSLGVAIGLLLMTTLCGLGASFWLSTRIADPIELEKRLRQSELDRFGQEMEIAAQIQTALLPRELSAQGFDLDIEVLAATEVGGDLVDYLPQSDGRFWLAIGDVTGHGLTPGLVMMMAQSLITGFVTESPHASPTTVLGRVNRSLYKNIRARMKNDNFMTLQLLHHEGDGQFVAAGLQCDILIHRATTGAVDRINIEGCWIGLLPEVEDLLKDVRFSLGAGDTMLLYTDGLIEAGNARKEQYDVGRLEQALAAGASLSTAALKTSILADVRSWMQSQADDISLIVLRRSVLLEPGILGTVPDGDMMYV